MAGRKKDDVVAPCSEEIGGHMAASSWIYTKDVLAMAGRIWMSPGEEDELLY